MTHVDAIEVEVISQSLVGVVQQMQNSLFRTGYSTIIRESRDASCAILDLRGSVVAQHTVLPLHLGAFPASLAAVLEHYRIEDMRDGDAFIVNHPYYGGSPHASDMAVIAPIMLGDEVFGFSGSIAHKSDIGGLVPGTNSGQAREIFHEGLLVPPVQFSRGFEVVREVEAILRANSRTPRLVVGDLHGQVGSARLAADRLRSLCAKYGAETVRQACDGLLELTEKRVRAAVSSWPDGTYFGSRTLHAEGIEGGNPVVIRVAVTIEGDRICFDFAESDDQVAGPYNIRPPLVRAVCYALKCLVDPDIPANGGFAAAVDAKFRPGSLLSPELPAPVNTYMTVAVATADALFDALGDGLPAARIAESSKGTNGTLSHVISRHGHPQVQYELPAGAIGARHDKDGVSAAVLAAELAAWNRARGRSVGEHLDDIYRRVGLFVTEQVSITRPGAGGLAEIRAAMARFRAAPPAALAGHAVEQVLDLSRGEGGLPPSDVLVFRLAGGRRVIMRPSGTEPKLKSYYEVRIEVGPGEPLAGARARGLAELGQLRDAHQALLA